MTGIIIISNNITARISIFTFKFVENKGLNQLGINMKSLH